MGFKSYITEIRALCPKTGEMSLYHGPLIIGINVEAAQQYCDNNGLGYCKVVREFVSEEPSNKVNRTDKDLFIDKLQGGITIYRNRDAK